MSDDDENDFQVSQWRNGQWTQCGSSQQSRRGQSSLRQSQLNFRPSQQRSQRRQSSQQSQPVTSTNTSNNAAQDLLVTLIQSAVAAKLPAKEKKPKLPERERIQCLLCASTLATQTTLFRHYKTQHNITNPARFLGYKESNVFNLDSTMEEFQCTDCGFVVPNSHALDIHVKAAHNRESNNNNSKEKCNECGFEANNRHELDVHSRVHASSSAVNSTNNSTPNNTTANSTTNNTPNNTTINSSGANVNQNANKTKDILNGLHKCDKCVCYFEEKRKLDEHMKDAHGTELVCNICNKYLAYEDYEDHFKSSHPEVFNTKKVQKREKTVVRKFFRNMSSKIVAVYKCVKCNDTFTDESNAKRHFRLHKKVKTTKTVDNDTENQDINDNNETQTVKDTLYICGACKTSTASYDMAVEHSQSHITNPNIQFATKTCEICHLKFEIICYEQHVTTHCVEENLRKESFTCYEFDYNLLLSNDWLNFLPEEERQRIISKSIYEHTRSVKMRVLSGENSSSLLFRCGKCKRFVSPSYVSNHCRNYDTCLRINEEFPCSICTRIFNDRNTLDDHKKLHDDEKSFKVVVFNTEVDKSFNELLNVAHSKTQESLTPQEPSNAADNVLYKCLCSLCFISIETADEHVKVCPGKEPKQYCQKCNYLFSHSEIMPHYFKHHTTKGNTTFVVENISPDIIEVESDHEPEKDDDEIEVITLSDDEEIEQIPNAAENQPHLEVSMEVSSNSEVHSQGSSILSQTTNIVFSRATIKNEDQLMNDETSLTDCDNNDAMSVGSNDIIEDTDSQDTDINGEHDKILEDVPNTESETENLYNNAIKTELKCVPTSALMNPLYYENRAIKQYNIIHEIESETQNHFGVDTTHVSRIKEERDTESQYIRISGRPTLRSVTNHNEIPTYDLLTDDEDTPDDVQFDNSATADNNYLIDTNDTTVVNVFPTNEGFDNIDENVSTDHTVELTDNQQQINTAPASDLSTDIDVHDVSAGSVPEITNFVEIDENLVRTPLGTFNTVEAKKNKTLKIDTPIVSNDSVANRELEELDKIKQKLIALNENGTVNKYNEDVSKSLTEPVFQELSLRAVFEKTCVSDQNVRIDIEYNSITNDRSDEISRTDVYAPIKRRNSYRAGNALDFRERLRLTDSNMALDVQQKQTPKRAIATVADTSTVIHKPDDHFTMIDTAQNDQNIANIMSSPVVSRGKISMRLKRDMNVENDNNCCLA